VEIPPKDAGGLAHWLLVVNSKWPAENHVANLLVLGKRKFGGMFVGSWSSLQLMVGREPSSAMRTLALCIPMAGFLPPFSAANVDDVIMQTEDRTAKLRQTQANNIAPQPQGFSPIVNYQAFESHGSHQEIAIVRSAAFPMTTNTARVVHASGQAKAQVGDVHVYNDPNANRCLADLRSTDPRDDKARIEQTKGGLLRDAYKWILGHGDFRRWREDKHSRLLWIKGDAGKGKTMLLCGIVNELQQSLQGLRANAGVGNRLGVIVKKLSRRLKKLSPSPAALSFFFCQGTDSRINHATAVLRGVIFLLLLQQPSLIQHIQESYNHAGRRLFDGPDSFDALSQALSRMLGDRRVKGCYMVIDALDECETGLPQLLDFIVQTAWSTSTDVKWIVSSRNRHDIEQQLRLNDSGTMLSLELNARHVTHAINTYIEHKVSHLVSLEGDRQLQYQVRDTMRRKADGTFLWPALVAKELQNVQAWDVLAVLEQIPPGLVPFYARWSVFNSCRLRIANTAAVLFRLRSSFTVHCICASLAFSLVYLDMSPADSGLRRKSWRCAAHSLRPGITMSISSTSPKPQDVEILG